MTDMFGRYRIDSVLGEGGMGEVFEAYDTRNERTVALKRLRSGLADSAEYRTRFQRESRAAAGLASPHVVPIHDVGEIDGRLYIDMRLIRGRDLGKVISQSGPLAPARVAMIVVQVADALRSAHEAGLIHRDVKPSNVLLADTGAADFAYLVDFGVAKTVDGAGTSLTGTGVALGTMAYMAPELFLGSTADHRVDVYALACMAHEALTGSPPFTAAGPALMYQHLSAEPPRASSVRPGIPAEAEEVLLRGMAKDPATRYSTAPEFAAALSTALTGSSGEIPVAEAPPTQGQAAAGSGPTPAQPPAGSVPTQGQAPIGSGPTATRAPAGSGANWTVGAGQQPEYAAAGTGWPPAGPPGYTTPPGYTAPPGYTTPQGWAGQSYQPPAGTSGPGPTAYNHPSGPQGAWYPPPGGPTGPATGQGRSRRMHPGLIVAIAVLSTLVIGLGAVVAIALVRGENQPVTPPAASASAAPPTSSSATAAPDEDVPVPNAPSDLALLREVFTIPANCSQVATATAENTMLASLSCSDPANQATVFYDIWPDAAAARKYFDVFNLSEPSTGATYWSKGAAEKRQGPYWLGTTSDGRVQSIALYEGKRFTMYIVAPTGAQEDKAFSATSGMDVDDVPN